MICQLELVTAMDRVLRDLGERGDHDQRGGSIPVVYDVNLASMRSRLAQFLAEHITTTRSDNPGSRLLLVYPETVGESHADKTFVSPSGNASENLRQAAMEDPAGLARELRRLALEIEQRGLSATQGTPWNYLRTALFRWPVFGAVSVKANTPEDYFEHCVTLIRASGAIPVEAGLARIPVEESMLRTFARGQGCDLVKRCRSEIAAMESRNPLLEESSTRRRFQLVSGGR